jgi:hypothetical protein
LEMELVIGFTFEIDDAAVGIVIVVELTALVTAAEIVLSIGFALDVAAAVGIVVAAEVTALDTAAEIVLSIGFRVVVVSAAAVVGGTVVSGGVAAEVDNDNSSVTDVVGTAIAGVDDAKSGDVSAAAVSVGDDVVADSATASVAVMSSVVWPRTTPDKARIATSRSGMRHCTCIVTDLPVDDYQLR